MLKGRILYHDEHLGEIVYGVAGTDNYDVTRLIIENNINETLSNVSNGLYCFDKQVDKENLISNPYQGIGENFRKLEVSRANKCKTNITNRVMATRISALLKYAIAESGKAKNYEVTDFRQAFKTKRHIQLGDLGYIKTDTGLVTEVALKGKYVSIFLETVDIEKQYEGMFKSLQEKDTWGRRLTATPVKNFGYKLDTNILGFEYESKVANDSASGFFHMYQTVAEVMDAHRDKSIAWVEGRKYVIVTDEILDEVIADFSSYNGFIAFDTETTGLKITFKSRIGEGDQLVGVVLSKEKGTGYYFPLQHKLFPNLCGGDHFYFMERYMRKILETKKIVVHNASFDWKVAHIYDINTNVVYDTMTALSITERYRKGKSFKVGLKNLIKIYFGWDMLDLKDFAINGNFGTDFTFADLPYELVRAYAPADGDMTLTLFEYLEEIQILDKMNARIIFKDEITFSKAVGYSEFYGYKINTDNIPVMEANLHSELARLSAALQAVGGADLNPSSAKQVGDIIFDKLGAEDTSGKKSTKKNLLKTIAKQENLDGTPRFPFVVDLLKYREYEKLYSGFIKRIHEFASEDGFIHPSVAQFGADTGRTSARDPNYQSYNDVIKQNIIPREGFIHFDCDFSQIEYRVLASMAMQMQLISEFNNPDMDYHTYQASRMFNIDYALVPKSLRQQSKGINFGLPYGMGDPSLGAAIFGEKTDENTRQAGILRKKFFEGQEAIEAFFLRVRNEGVAKGYTSTLFGRRRYYDKNMFNEGAIRRQAGNHVIQGSAADIYKRACVRMFKRIEKERWLGKVLYNVFVHDELLMEVHESIDMYYFFKAWREEFQVPIEGFCTLYAGAGVGYNWYDAKKQDLTPQFIEEIVSLAESGNYTWDGNMSKFVQWTHDNFFKHKYTRVVQYLRDTENHNKPFNPTINALCNETTEVGMMKVAEVGKWDNLVAVANKTLQEKLPTDANEVIKVDKESGKKKLKWKSSKINDYLSIFCAIYGVDYSKITIPELDERPKQTEQPEQQETSRFTYEDDDYSLVDVIRNIGYFLEDDTDILYLQQKPINVQGQMVDSILYLNNLGVFTAEQKGFRIGLVNCDTHETSITNAYVEIGNYEKIRQVYNYANQIGVATRY